MIITRTPLRISIGGGTDLPSYSEKHGGGLVISAAINKYVHISIHRSLLPGYILKYCETEQAARREDIREALECGRVADFGPLLQEHWMRKRSRCRSMSSSHLNQIHDLARGDGGASGGKLVGAGFLLLHTHDRRRLRDCMLRAGLMEMDFTFDHNGSVVLLRNV